MVEPRPFSHLGVEPPRGPQQRVCILLLSDSLREPDDDVAGRLRLSTSRGRPLATDSFLSKLERLLGRPLRPLPVGRPEKKRSKARKPRKQ